MSDNLPPIANVSSKNFHARLFENILALDDFLDAVLSAEGKRIQVHRFVLAAGSKYFHKMLRCSDSSKNFPIFVFTDIRFEHMKRIVQYLYTGKTQVRADELDEFFRVAKQLEILGLHHENVPEDLSGMGARSKPRNSGQTSTNTTASEQLSIIIEQQDKQHLNSNGLNNGSNNSESMSSQKSNDRKRARIEKGSASAKRSTAHLSKPSKVPPGQRNGTSSNGSGETVSKTDARSEKVAENNGDEQEGNGSPRRSDESNGNSQIRCNARGCGMSFQTSQELWRHKKQNCGKTKEFQCQTCQKSFYLRIGLQNHYKTSTCEQPDQLNESI